MVRPIRHFLTEFSSGAETPSSTAPVRSPGPGSAQRHEAAAGPDALASRLADSFQQGVAAGRAQERQEYETQAAELSIDCERRLGELRSRLSKALADQLTEEIRAGIERARSTISTRLATALVPLLRASLTHAAIESFVAELGDLVDLTDGAVIEVACPRELVEPVRAAIGEAMSQRGLAPGSVRCIPEDRDELRVAVRDSIVETRLAEWLSRLDGVLR
jgi:hypothetical protein